MNPKNNRRKALWIILFVLLVAVSGLGLAASGNLENPLGTLIGTGGEGGEHRGPPTGANNQVGTRPAQGAGQRGESGDQSSINWSAIGGVLYNAWFLFAAAAVVIVIQTVGGSILHLFKPRVPAVASP